MHIIRVLVKRMKHIYTYFNILFLVLLFALSYQPIARADVIPPDEKPVTYCFEVANIDKYPNYFLVANIKSANPSLAGNNKILQKGKCLGLNGYREYSEIFAIKKSDVKPTEIVKTNQEQAIKNFDSKKTKLIPSKLVVYSVRTFPGRYQAANIGDVLEIASINQKELKLRNKEVIYTFTNKKSEKIKYQKQGQRPLPKTSRGALLIFGLFGISLMAGIPILKQTGLLKFSQKK